MCAFLKKNIHTALHFTFFHLNSEIFPCKHTKTVSFFNRSVVLHCIAFIIYAVFFIF